MPFPYTHVPVEYITFPQGEEHNPLKGVSPDPPALLETVHSVSCHTSRSLTRYTNTPQMAESSRGIPSTFDILLGTNYDSDEDNRVTRDNFELSTAELRVGN